MKNPANLKHLFAALAALAVGTTSITAADVEKPDCAVVIQHLEKEIAKDPSRLILAVEDALTLNEKCACEIVHTAITVSKADSEMVGNIVSAAVKTAPTAASTIAECALAASPKSASAIKSAMTAALGQGDIGGGNGKETVSSGKEPVGSGKEVVASGKSPVMGKEPVAMKEDHQSNGEGVLLTGIYLFPPGIGQHTTEVIEKEVTKVIKIIKIRHKTSRPHTDS